MAVLKLTADNFEKEVLQSGLPVLVDFWAVWCGPCQMQGPVIDQAAEELGDKLKVGKLNVDEEGSIAQQYSVMSIPTLILFKEGKAAKKVVGFHSLEQIKELLV